MSEIYVIKISEAAANFSESIWSDSNFLIEFCGSDIKYFRSRLWEVILHEEFRKYRILADVAPSKGPDFKLVINGRIVWVEAVCPEPKDIPLETLEYPKEIGRVKVTSRPNNEILLRYSAAIFDKKRKIDSYFASGVICDGDAVVIAVDGRWLNAHVVSSFFGVSQLPAVLEAVYPIGPIGIAINPFDMSVVSSGSQYRKEVEKKNGSSVNLEPFLTEDYRRISAVIGASAGLDYFCNQSLFALVHNINADVRVSAAIGKFPYEYAPTLSQGALRFENMSDLHCRPIDR